MLRPCCATRLEVVLNCEAVPRTQLARGDSFVSFDRANLAVTEKPEKNRYVRACCLPKFDISELSR